MTEMTPDLWDIWWKEVKDTLPAKATHRISMHDWQTAGRVVEAQIIAPLVAAERAIYEEAIDWAAKEARKVSTQAPDLWDAVKLINDKAAEIRARGQEPGDEPGESGEK